MATVERYDDTSDPTNFIKATGEMTVRQVPMRDFGLPEVAAAYDDMARQFAEQQERMMMNTMDEVTARTGNVVNGEGKALSADKLLELFEKMEHSFSADGSWNAPTLWGGAPTSTVQEVMSDPAFQVRLNELLIRKRNEYRRREAGRILVG